jgi:hypothetical protein
MLHSSELLRGHAAQACHGRCAAATDQQSSRTERSATAHEKVILSDPIPHLPQPGQNSEESREARHGDSSPEARRSGRFLLEKAHARLDELRDLL